MYKPSDLIGLRFTNPAPGTVCPSSIEHDGKGIAGLAKEIREAVEIGDRELIATARLAYATARNRRVAGHAKHCHSGGDRLLTCTCKPVQLKNFKGRFFGDNGEMEVQAA